MTQAELEHAYTKAHDRYWLVRNLGHGDYEYLQGLRDGLYSALHPHDGSNLGAALLEGFKEDS